MTLSTTDVTIARIYLTEASDMLDTITSYLKDEAKISGFTVFRAIRGLGETGEHASRLIDVSLNLPLIIEFFDVEATMLPVIEHLTQWVNPKHIVFWSAKANATGLS